MKILVLLGHPQPGSFNHALAETVVATLEESGHEVVFHDLYAEGFDPIMSAAEIPTDGPLEPEIAHHCEELASAEGIVVVHPNWWGQPPALLKGWIDRVVRPEVAYRFLEGDSGEGVPEGLLKVRTAIVLNTSNTRPKRELTVFGDPLEALWVHCVFAFCGVEDVRRRTFGVVVTSTDEERAAWLDEATEIVRGAFPAAR
ncbi:MAG TPA: NAD(P)H-dependent oxidoreductase [Gaiellaceae bacterium]